MKVLPLFRNAKHIFWLLVLVGCAKEQKPTVSTIAPVIPPFDSLYIDEVIPSGNGGVYLSAGGSVWYAEGSTVVMVKTQDGEALDPYEIIPTSGSGIYVRDIMDVNGLWYVDGSKAVPLREVSTADQMDTVIPAMNMAVASYIKKMQEESKIEEYMEE